MKEKKYDGFLFNFFIYIIALIIASAFPFIVRTIVSFFIKTPSISEQNADASYLFNVIYPIMGVVTIAAFLFAGYIASYIASYKVAYKAKSSQIIKKIKMQIILSSIVVFIWNFYLGFCDNFSGFWAAQFWYPSALTGSLFGLFDKTNILATVSASDLNGSNFIIEGLNPIINFITFVYAILISTLFTYVAYKGRLKGEADGIDSYNKYIEEIRTSDTSIR